MQPGTCCPVCTLYLREGITLESHLNTHPKDQVIQALTRLCSPQQFTGVPQNSIINTGPTAPVMHQMAIQPPHVQPLSGVFPISQFINPVAQMTKAVTYQQFVSSNGIPQYIQVPTIVAPNNQTGFPLQAYQYVPQYNPPVYPSQVSVISQHVINKKHEVSSAQCTIATNTSEELIYSQNTIQSNGAQPNKPSVIILNTIRQTEEPLPEPPPLTPRPRTHSPPENDEVEWEPPTVTNSMPVKHHETTKHTEDNRVLQQQINSKTKEEEDIHLMEEGECQYLENENYNQECRQFEDEVEPFEHLDVSEEIEQYQTFEVEDQIEHHEDFYKPESNKKSYVPGNGKSEKALQRASEGDKYKEENEYYETKDASDIYYDQEIDFTPNEQNEIEYTITDLHTVEAQDVLDLQTVKKTDIISLHSWKDQDQLDKIDWTHNDHNYIDIYYSKDETSLNIEADEVMPAKGELSEQESLAADNSNWALSYQQPNEPKPFTLKKKFKCSQCSLKFSCPKERRVHKNSVHQTVKKREFRCIKCALSFTSLKERREHLSQVKHERPELTALQPQQSTSLSLNIPERVYTNKTKISIKKEKSERIVKRDLICVKCNIVTTSFEKLSDHYKAVHGETGILFFCDKCNEPHNSIVALSEHIRTAHFDSKYKCEKCNVVFTQASQWTEHLKEHPLKCDKCDKIFYRKANLNLHLKRHMKVKPFECSVCPKSFVTRQKLEEHTNGHAGLKPLKCPLCEQRFSRHSNLIQHRNLHHLKVKKKIRDYVCRCGEVFHSRRKLEWHKEIHDAKPKTCSFCTQKFIHSSSLTRHIRRMHMPKYLPDVSRENDNIECPVCKKTYIRSSLIAHMRAHTGARPFGCKVCNKRFSTKWNLQLHQWTHQSRNNMPFKCSQCKGAFFRQSDYLIHLNSHKNVKPFSCNICGQRFIRKYNCIRHQMEHKANKQFRCTFPDCGKCFHRSYYLKDHIKVHNGVRPFSCHVCGKASSTKSNHNKHVRIHDTREPVNTEN